MILRGRAVASAAAATAGVLRLLLPWYLAGVAVVPATAAATDVPGRAFDRFVTIWLENEDFDDVQRNADIEALAKSGILLTNYYGLTHPSQPNYIASVGGDYFGLDHDDLVSIPENVSTVADLLDTRRIEWRVYMEDAPGPGFMAQSSTDEKGMWSYVRKHNPMVSFQSVANNGSRFMNLLSLDDFRRDVRDQDLPQWAHITPNMLHDGHNTSLDYATRWTRDFLEPLLQDDFFSRKTLVLLTYDESGADSGPNRIASLLLGGAVSEDLRGTTDDTFYTHYSMLATLENNWELPHLGRYDVGANVFDLVARQTGYRNRGQDALNQSAVDLSVSYPGFLSGRQRTDAIPAPNPFLTGAGGKGIVGSVPEAWRKPPRGEAITPYDGSGRVYDGTVTPPVAVRLSSGARRRHVRPGATSLVQATLLASTLALFLAR